MENRALVRYREELTNIPAPGGNGCHSSLLGIANLGVIAGVDAQVIYNDIRSNIPHGNRRVSDGEISDAIKKALSDYSGNKPIPIIKKSKPKFDGNKVREKIITRSEFAEVDIWEASPIRIDWEPNQDAIYFLESIFLPDDLLFIGEREDIVIPGENIRTQREWIEFFKSGRTAGPLICINPLTGKPAKTKSGDKDTYRGDYCVKAFRHCLVEFDNMTMEEQIRFWGSDTLADLPVKALVESGKKSIHAWLDVSKLTEVNTFDQWQVNIKSRLYESILNPLGVDGACSNPSRLSRLPGYLRNETGKYQKLLWLSQYGRGVNYER